MLNGKCIVLVRVEKILHDSATLRGMSGVGKFDPTSTAEGGDVMEKCVLHDGLFVFGSFPLELTSTFVCCWWRTGRSEICQSVGLWLGIQETKMISSGCRMGCGVGGGKNKKAKYIRCHPAGGKIAWCVMCLLMTRSTNCQTLLRLTVVQIKFRDHISAALFARWVYLMSHTCWLDFSVENTRT